MSTIVLGLDIGGANLKAATSDGRTASVPFPLWKRHLELPQALGQLVEQFPDAEELAITMTGELCDCYETKREGVNHIVTSVMNVSRSRPIRVWSTQQRFLNTNEAKENYLAVAAANWHALAMYAGAYVLTGPAILVDVGSTTTDIIPLYEGEPITKGLTDSQRMQNHELVYTGVRRTPLCSLMGEKGAAELFATTQDVYLMLGYLPESLDDYDTADNRPMTKHHAHARISRMLCGDGELILPEVTRQLAADLCEKQRLQIANAIETVWTKSDFHKYGFATRVIASGSGEFLARMAIDRSSKVRMRDCISLGEKLGPQLSEVAPAYAVARLAAERRS